MATDPFQWADQFTQLASQQAKQSNSQAQQSLLSLFQEEAARQRPYATMPADLAAYNQKLAMQAAYATPSADPYELAEHSHNLKLRELAARHGYTMDEIEQRTEQRIREGREIGQVTPNTGFGSMNRTGKVFQKDDGSWWEYVVLGGKEYPERLTPEQAQRRIQELANEQ